MARGTIKVIKSKSTENIEQGAKKIRGSQKQTKQLKSSSGGKGNQSITKLKDGKGKSSPTFEVPQEKIKIRKQFSLNQLSSDVSSTMVLDKASKIRLDEIEKYNTRKKEKIKQQIRDIKKRNEGRIRQIEEYEKNEIKKLNEAYKSEKQRQKRLLEEYEKKLEIDRKLNGTKQYRDQLEEELWKIITIQQAKLKKMIRDYRKKQELIMKEPTIQTVQKIKRANANIKEEIKQEVKVQKVKGDSKKMGNQYLQYAKQIQQEKKKAKMKLLDINLKCIDYSQEMASKIFRNTGDLSRVKKIQKMESTPISIKSVKFQKQNSSKLEEIKEEQVKQNDIKEENHQDQQIQKCLKEIKSNLSELEEKVAP